MDGAERLDRLHGSRPASRPASAVRSAGRPAGRDQAEDAQLAAALDDARGGDSAAFAVLYRAVQPRLLRYAAVLVGQDAEDVTAEAWLQIARDLRGFTGTVDGFRGWTATVVRNRALDHLRSRSRRPTDPVDTKFLLDLAGTDDTAAAAAERISTGEAIAWIARLPADQAEAVLLRAVVGLDARTAGKVLGKRAGAVRVAAHRGLNRLAAQLADDAATADQERGGHRE